jgi:hypothetical protein
MKFHDQQKASLESNQEFAHWKDLNALEPNLEDHFPPTLFFLLGFSFFFLPFSSL